ncbi:MAG: M20/M25/M40 family metallo-hydrolase [Oscillospiraceae bacterium]
MLKTNLKNLCQADGLTGREDTAVLEAEKVLRKYTNDVRVDKLGSLIGFIKSKKENAKTILLDAHIDEIGLMVTGIEENGFLRINKCGGVSNRLLVSQEVTVHTANGDLFGVIGGKPTHLISNEDANKAPTFEELFVDIGYGYEEACKKVALGDVVIVNGPFYELLNGQFASKAIDDRCCMVSILQALELLKDKDVGVNIAVLFSSQEERGGSGAKVSAYDINPDYAIAVDVTCSATPDMTAHKYNKIGDGVVICVGPALKKECSDKMINICKEKNIKYQIGMETGGYTGTNADDIIVTRNGVETVLLSVAMKYMHSPIETVLLEDLETTAQAIAEYVLSL